MFRTDIFDIEPLTTENHEELKKEAKRIVSAKNALVVTGYIENVFGDNTPMFCKNFTIPHLLFETLKDLSYQGVIRVRHQNSKSSVIANLRYDYEKKVYTFYSENDPEILIELSPGEFTRKFNEENF